MQIDCPPERLEQNGEKNVLPTSHLQKYKNSLHWILDQNVIPENFTCENISKLKPKIFQCLPTTFKQPFCPR